MAIRVVVGNKFVHLRENASVRATYPDWIHATIVAGLAGDGMSISTATLDQDERGPAQLQSDYRQGRVEPHIMARTQHCAAV
jgi:trehalose utilization protein